MKRLALLPAAVLLLAAAQEPALRHGLDDFSDASRWIAAPAEGVGLKLSSDAGEKGKSLRLDFDFSGHAGWAAARLPVALTLPGNWALDLRLKGKTPPQTLEVKFLDPGGENVWWSVRRDFDFPREWTTLRVRKRQVAFAWGPVGGGEPREIGAIEIAITAAAGGRGTVWLEEIALEELAPDAAGPILPSASASSSRPGFGPELAVDGDLRTGWRSAPDSGESQWLALDLKAGRELGGLTLVWDREDFPRRYAVEMSDDGKLWTRRREISVSRGGRVEIFLPESQCRLVRLSLEESSRRRGYALDEATVEPPSFSQTPTAFLEAVAGAEPRGQWPRSFRGEQIYWSLVGADAARDKGLLSEDGALEAGRGGFSLEPFLRSRGRLLGWADAKISHALASGDLPIPSVTRRHSGGLELEILAFADGPPEASTLRVRYRVRNTTAAPASVDLDLAVRPTQVNPPTQFLAVPGGASPIRKISWDGRAVHVDGHRQIVPMMAPAAFGASSWDGGEISVWLAEGTLPPAATATDPDGFASGALQWALRVPARGFRDVFVAVPLFESAPSPTPPSDSGGDFDARLEATERNWREKLGGVSFDLPPAAAALARTARSSLAWILVNRDGPAIQPGSRSYARSWIRDGALICAALLRLNRAAEVRDYLRWYAPYEYSDGRVPCCVDRRGADPVPENDSYGELLFLAGEYFRFTHDRATLEAVWPQLKKAAAHIDVLRDTRRTDEYRRPDRLAFFGLLPESISHEGYSARPVHSYWDDFWAVRGLSDAAEIAARLGHDSEAMRLTASRDELREDFQASIRRVVADKRIGYIPGSADLADFDATSTTIALSPGEEESRLPRKPLQDTFERYWANFEARRSSSGAAPDDAYTPYEWRLVGTFVRLGWRERARQLMRFLLADRRPLEWNQWAEVVGRNPRTPRFLGDMPHAWVASDFLRSFFDLFAYERPRDHALVLAAGIPSDWLAGGRSVGVARLQTQYGPLTYSMRTEGNGLRVSIAGGLLTPPGGVALQPPLGAFGRRVTVDGKRIDSSGNEVVLRKLPAEVLYERPGKGGR